MLGLTRMKYLRALQMAYGLALEKSTATQIELSNLGNLIVDRDRSIAEYERRLEDPEVKARWSSPDGKKVLNDLQNALNLIRSYQRALGMLSAADPNYEEADALLEAWGMQGDPDKIVLGLRTTQQKTIPTYVVDKKGIVATYYTEDSYQDAKDRHLGRPAKLADDD